MVDFKVVDDDKSAADDVRDVVVAAAAVAAGIPADNVFVVGVTVPRRSNCFHQFWSSSSQFFPDAVFHRIFASDYVA